MMTTPLTVIASEAKQSSAEHDAVDCFVAALLAMTELGSVFGTGRPRCP